MYRTTRHPFKGLPPTKCIAFVAAVKQWIQPCIRYTYIWRLLYSFQFSSEGVNLSKIFS